MLLTISQAGISIFGIIGFLLVTRETRRSQVYGAACGIIATPFWFIMIIMTDQLSLVPLNLLYTYGWVRKAVVLYNSREKK